MTSPHPAEIELKLSLPQQQAAAFARMITRRYAQPRPQALVTRYFDTPDFDLGAQGVALRLRRVGRRWLQTLKTEGTGHGGLSQRAEYEVATSRGAIDWSRFPEAAQALVPESLRAALAPVFETRFTRNAWQVVDKRGTAIEVALDVGECRAGSRREPICEIELELKTGQPDTLFALALGWARQFDCLPLDISKAERGMRLAQGAAAEPFKSAAVTLDAGMRVEDGFAAIVQACLAQFQGNLPGVLTSDDIEYVHQARVALRRLRAALRIYRRVCVLPDELLAELRVLAAALGPARDWDVLCIETLPAIAPHYHDATAWRRGMDALEAQRAEVRAAMQAALKQAHPGVWLLQIQRWLLLRGWRAAPEAQRFMQMSPLKKWARQALARQHRLIERGARRFAQLQAEERHALRIAIKRQRYAGEFFQTLFAGRPQTRYLAVLREAQDSLGRANDARVAEALLTGARVDAEPMQAFVRGWLAALQAGGMPDTTAKQLKNFVKLAPYW